MGDKMKPRRTAKFNSGDNQRSHKTSKKLAKKDCRDNESFKHEVKSGGKRKDSSGSRVPRHLKEIVAPVSGNLSVSGEVSTGNNPDGKPAIAPELLQFMPMNQSAATFRPPVVPTRNQIKSQAHKAKQLTGGEVSQEPEIRFRKGGKPQHVASDKKLPAFVKLMPNEPLEIAVVKHFNAADDKLFGFATTQFPNESGGPELFFHIGGGCRLWMNQNHEPSDPARAHMAEMVLVDYRDKREKPLPVPRQGDEICVIRGHGNKGEKIALWCYHRDYEALVSEFVSPPKIRLVLKSVGFNARSTNTKVIWEGTNIVTLRNAFPKWKIQEGIKSTTAGTERHYFQQQSEDGSWKDIDDPR